MSCNSPLPFDHLDSTKCSCRQVVSQSGILLCINSTTHKPADISARLVDLFEYKPLFHKNIPLVLLTSPLATASG